MNLPPSHPGQVGEFNSIEHRLARLGWLVYLLDVTTIGHRLVRLGWLVYQIT